MTTPSSPERIAEWYRLREARDRAELAEIAARYRLQPAASMDELLDGMYAADAEKVREIMSHNLPSAAAMGFNAVQFEEFMRSPGPTDPAGE